MARIAAHGDPAGPDAADRATGHPGGTTGSGPAGTGGARGSATDAMLMGRVARRYYVRGESKKDIAAALGISRFKVARLLDEAVASGLVRIEIGTSGSVDVDLSTRLEDELGLHRALVVVDSPTTPVPPPAELSSAQLAVVAAELVGELVGPDDVLGLPWSRTIHAMVEQLRSLPPCEVVQLCGDQAVPGTYTSAVEVATTAARLAGGPAHVFFAPLVADEESAAVAFARQRAVRDALDAAGRVTVAFVGIGAWAPGLSSVHDAVAEEDRAAVAAQGIVGEVAGVFYGPDGAPVRTALTPRLVAVDGADLLAVPHVVGIASGTAKAASALAAVRGGLLDGLVVDQPLARALLDLAASPAPDARAGGAAS